MNALSVLPAVIEGVKDVYNMYQNYKGNNTLGLKNKELRGLGHYNRTGKKLSIYHR